MNIRDQVLLAYMRLGPRFMRSCCRSIDGLGADALDQVYAVRNRREPSETFSWRLETIPAQKGGCGMTSKNPEENRLPTRNLSGSNSRSSQVVDTPAVVRAIQQGQGKEKLNEGKAVGLVHESVSA